MKVNFITSDFPNGFTDAFISQLLTHLTSTKNFVFVASDFKSHERTVWYMNLLVQQFAKKGIVFKREAVVDFNISRTEAIELINKADVVWLSGGPTLTQMAHINDYRLVDALQGRDGITIGMSAGSINMAKQVVLAKDINDNVPELSIYNGIGLVDFNIEPHLNEASPEHMRDIHEAAQHSTIYGLYDESFIVDIAGERTFCGPCQVFDGSHD